MRFSRREDLKRVLSAPLAPAGAPFRLTWKRWSKLVNGSSGTFTFRIIVGIKNVPAHALSAEVLQTLLGSSCAKIVIATPEDDGVVAHDGRETFVAAWCVHPLLVPEQKIIVIPEPTPPHDPCGVLALREHEVIHPSLRTIRCLARMRVIEFRDWDAVPPSSSDEDFPGDEAVGRGGGPWPGFVRIPYSRPPTFRSRDACGAPALGRGAGAAFRLRRVVPEPATATPAAARGAVVRVGEFARPIVEDRVLVRYPMHGVVAGNQEKEDGQKELYADFCSALGRATPVRQDSISDPMWLELVLPPAAFRGDSRSPRRDVDIDVLGRCWGGLQLSRSPWDPMHDEAGMSTGRTRISYDPGAGPDSFLCQGWAVLQRAQTPSRAIQDELTAVWPPATPQAAALGSLVVPMPRPMTAIRQRILD